MLTGQPEAASVLARLDELLTDPPYLTVAHHASTEAGILRRYAHVCPTVASTPTLDTVRLARTCLPDLSSYALDALLTRLDLVIPADRHRALADATVTGHLFARLVALRGDLHRWSQLAQLRHLVACDPPSGPRLAQA
jgi:DNA polymerase-3 subunit epsilon